MLSTQIIQSLLAICPKNSVWQTPIEGLFLHHLDNPTASNAFRQQPSLCVMLMGERQLCIGDECSRFNQDNMSLCPVNTPVMMTVEHATPNKPYFALSLQFDLAMVAKVAGQLDLHNPLKNTVQPKDFLTLFNPNQELINALERLLALLYSPNFEQKIAILAPLYLQEIYYYLLTSPQGNKLRELCRQGSHAERIFKATTWLNEHFNQPLNIAELANLCGMSESGFYQHFRQITQQSPLQYQKNLRLTEAQRLIQQGGNSISQIAYDVGYESPSQFSREYKRYFGRVPSEEI
ncbi:AraC family transcriptional regulator N-terminal domain-containing protein [Lonepinella sp. MS14437]|uniref:AraC family transcriptional regulator n=1 Tax=Lonepinella sp. MS14437 TaxID=3003620 RepID=UPI0036DC3B87